MKMNPIVSKIQKLLAVARDQEGLPEGEVAAKLAMRMMVAHAITQEEVDEQELLVSDPMEKQSHENVGRGVWKMKVMHSIAEHCSCRMTYRTAAARDGGYQFQLYGHRSDIEIAVYLYAICTRQIQEAAKVYSKTTDYARDYRSGRTKMNNFRRSAARGLHVRLSEIRMDAKTESPMGYDLVCSRAANVSRWVDERYGRFRSGKSYAHGYSQEGYTAGKNVNLSSGLKGRRSVTGNKRLTG